MKYETLSSQGKILSDVFGWYGTTAILVAYFLISHGLVLFQALNVTGALGIVWVAWLKRSWQVVALNAVWVMVGATALAKVFF